MYSPLSMDKTKASQPAHEHGLDPPTEATHGHDSADGGSGTYTAPLNAQQRPGRGTAHNTYVSPTSIEMANMRFNETAPPVLSPTSSSPRTAGAVQSLGGSISTPPAAPVTKGGTGAASSSGVLSRNDMILNRSRQIPYSTMNDVADARHYSAKANKNSNNQTNSRSARHEKTSSYRSDRDMHQRRSGGGDEDREASRRRSQTRTDAKEHKRDAHGTHREDRHERRRQSASQGHSLAHQTQQKPRDRIRRPLAAAPKFGHPFASNPELPALETPSAAASSTSVAYANWDRLGLNTTGKNKSFTAKEAAVPGYGAAPLTNKSFGNSGFSAGSGLLGGPSAGPDRLAPHHSMHYDSEIVVGTTGSGPANNNNNSSMFKDSNSKSFGNTIDLASTPAKTFSELQKQQERQEQAQKEGLSDKVPVTSGILDDDEGALFQAHHARHVRVSGHHNREELSGSSGNSDPASGSTGHNNNNDKIRSHERYNEENARQRKSSSTRAGNATHRSHHNHHHTSNHNNKDNTDQDERYSDDNEASFSAASESDATTLVTRDSFGYPIYHPIFRHGAFGEYDEMERGRSGGFGGAPRASVLGAGGAGGGGGAGGPPAPTLEVPTTTDVPWDLRNIAEKEINKTFAFLSTRYFWFLIEYALRVTCIAMLIPAIIINLDLKYTPFVSTTFALTSVVIAVGTNFGQSCVFFVQYVKGGCIWLPLATICSALKLNRYLGAWFVVYVVLLFLMAMFTEKTTRRMCLLLYNISMVSLLSGDESLVFPTRVLADWALGAAFALVATLIPYPMLATRFSAHITKIMFKNTATCFTGILSCFWAPSNTERSMSMVRIRSLVRTLDHLIEKFDSYDAFTFYEVLIYETSERREVRKEKVRLLLKLKMNLRAMERVINMVQEKPQMIDLSERCLLLRDHLSVPMDDISRSMEALLWKLSEAKKYDQLRTLSGYFEATGRAMKRLQTEFDVGRRVLFYEHQEASMLHDGRMEEFVPLMTFFVFSIVNFWTTLEEFETFIDRHKQTNDWKESFKLVWNALIDPFVENAELIRLLCVRRAEPEVRVVIEAAKVSVAMLISVIFFYYVDNQSLLLTGPSIIAFVSGTNPVEAVQAGAARMSGTLIGAVLGFFAASLCHTAVDRVAALCVITFVMTFFRPGQKFGVICMYCNFVAVSSLAPTEQTADLTISRIQQNTFAIFIYCFISVAIFPVSPNHVLFKKRMVVMRSLNTTLQKLSSLFNDAARSYIETRMEIMRGAKTEDDVVSITHPESTTTNNNNNNNFGNLNAMRLRDGPSPPAGQQGNGSGGVNNNTIVKLKGLNNSDVVLPASRSNSNMIMPGAFTMAPQDTIVEKIFTDIFAMMDTMKATSSVMPLAADEFQIIPHEYPLRASGDVHAALYRLCALVYTMACAWKTMREKGYFTTDMLHILHNLAPIANDIARCIDRFTHVMEFYVRFPSSGLSSELTKGAMQFRALCVELSARKERDLIAVIRKTIMMKRIRDDDSVEEGGEDGDGAGGSGGPGGNEGGGGFGPNKNNNNNNNNDAGGGGACPPKQRSHLDEWGSRSSLKKLHNPRRRRSHEPPRRRRGSRMRSGSGHNTHRQRGASNGSGKHHSPHQQQRRRSSRSHLTSSQNDVSGLERRQRSHDVDPLDKSTSAVSQVRSAAPFYNAVSGHDNAQAGESTTTESTFKDSVMPRVDSRDQVRSRITAPVPNDTTWLPVPRSELPEMPSDRQQEQDMDQYQHAYYPRDEYGERESVSNNTSPRSRADGGGGGDVTNATRVFDPSVFPPPPLDEEQAAAVRRARLEAQLPPSMQGDSVEEHANVLRQSASVPSPFADHDAPPAPALAAAPPLGGDGGEERKRSQLWHPHATADSLSRQHSAHSVHASPNSHHHNQHSHLSHLPPQQHRSSRHPQRLVAHEESPAVKKPSALLRADRLRENIRGFGRQASTGAITRQHSSFEMRTFGASYTNIAAIDKAAAIVSHNPAHHRTALPRHHSHHFSPHQRGQNNHSHSHGSLYYEEGEEETDRGPDGEPVSRHASPHQHHHGAHNRGHRRAHTTSPPGSAGLDGSLPYGSREGDLALLGASGRRVGTHEPASLSSSDPHTADGIRRDGHEEGEQEQRSTQQETAPLPLSSRQGEPSTSTTNHRSQDRITLDQSSSDDEERHKPYHSGSDSDPNRDESVSSSTSSYSATSRSDSYDDDKSDRSDYGSSSGGDADSDSYWDDEEGSDTSSLVRFNDSFTTPITVQDAEGLHAFTLSLEMFGKELRRVLYGFEEMLQSL